MAKCKKCGIETIYSYRCVTLCSKCGAEATEVVEKAFKNWLMQSPQEVYECPYGCGKTVIILEDGNVQCQTCWEKFEPFDKVPAGMKRDCTTCGFIYGSNTKGANCGPCFDGEKYKHWKPVTKP